LKQLLRGDKLPGNQFSEANGAPAPLQAGSSGGHWEIRDAEMAKVEHVFKDFINTAPRLPAISPFKYFVFHC
jgi:hypothetical protein